MKPEPPPITITDPKRPEPAPDLLGQERDPWRPSRHQKVLALLTAAIVALLSGGVAEIRHVHHEQALDTAAVRGVVLLAGVDVAPLDPSHEMAVRDVQVTVGNFGKDPVRLVDVRVDRTGLPLPSGGLVLPAGATFVHSLVHTPCTARSGRARSVVVVAALRTTRGQLVTRRFVVAGGQLAQTNAVERVRCSTGLPEEAFGASVLSLTRGGDRIRARFRLGNSSSLAMTLVRLIGAPGLRVSASGLPVAIPPDSPSGPEIRLTIEAVDCAAFARYLQATTDEEPAMRVSLHGELEDGVGRISFFQVVDGVDLMSQLAGPCPELFATEPEAH